jgi:hypothetical protein
VFYAVERFDPGGTGPRFAAAAATSRARVSGEVGVLCSGAGTVDTNLGALDLEEAPVRNKTVGSGIL